ncbi:29222_t:CDS:2, partial [Racocetra persica]
SNTTTSSKQDSNEIKRSQSVNRGGESALKMPPYYSQSYSHQQYPGYYSYPPPPPKTGSFSEKPTKTEADTSTDQTQNEGVDDSSVEETGHTHTHMHNSDSATAISYYLQDPNMSYFPGWRPMQPPKPQTVVPPPMIDDEALSNLLMAWYYSGYYTGLFQ